MAHEQQLWINQTEFLTSYRITRETLNVLLKKLDVHIVFPKTIGTSQDSIENQLMTFLNYLGAQGSGASSATIRNSTNIMTRGITTLTGHHNCHTVHEKCVIYTSSC